MSDGSFSGIVGDSRNFVQREMDLPQNRHLRPKESEGIQHIVIDLSAPAADRVVVFAEEDRPERAPRATQKSWGEGLQEIYKRARTFDWAPLVSALKEDFLIAAENGQRVISLENRKLPDKATIVDLVMHMNKQELGVRFFTAEDSTGHIHGLKWDTLSTLPRFK